MTCWIERRAVINPFRGYKHGPRPFRPWPGAETLRTTIPKLYFASDFKYSLHRNVSTSNQQRRERAKERRLGRSFTNISDPTTKLQDFFSAKLTSSTSSLLTNWYHPCGSLRVESTENNSVSPVDPTYQAPNKGYNDRTIIKRQDNIVNPKIPE